MTKCIIVLSVKGSGSSACQKLLGRLPNVRHVLHTRHFQNETLYWTKAASVLEMPQRRMVDSEVPIARDKARTELIDLLVSNTGSYAVPSDDRELIFDGWRRLCEHHGPIFLEKSPHHLVQWSAIELILECMRKHPDLQFLLVGLVRNPMDTAYSAFRRFRSRPDETQYEWLTAYQNLRKLQEKAPDNLVIVRYEDIALSLEAMRPVFDYCGANPREDDVDYLHRRSISRWRDDPLFGFVPAEPVVQLAESYGYDRASLTNRTRFLWPAHRELSRGLHQFLVPTRKAVRRLVRS